MGLRGQNLFGEDVNHWQATRGFGLPPAWPSDDAAKTFKVTSETARAVELRDKAERLSLEAGTARLEYEMFRAAHFSEAVPSEQFPFPWQRERYAGKWAVLMPSGAAMAFRDTKAEAETAAKALVQ